MYTRCAAWLAACILSATFATNSIWPLRNTGSFTPSTISRGSKSLLPKVARKTTQHLIDFAFTVLAVSFFFVSGLIPPISRSILYTTLKEQALVECMTADEFLGAWEVVGSWRVGCIRLYIVVDVRSPKGVFFVWDGNKKYKSLICEAPGESIFVKKRDFFLASKYWGAK